MSKTAKVRTVVAVDDPDMEFFYAEAPDEMLSVGKLGKVRMVKKSKLTPGKPINDTGIEPVEYKCVVKLDPVEETTSGGIIKVHIDREQMAHTQATLLAVGGNAFDDWKGRKPVPGDRIMITKYSGITREADPTDLIRVIHDKEILAVLV
jgi:co-chaperonin GroES (HSP10)